MSDMRDRLAREFEEYDRAEMGLRNAFGYVDDPAEWADDPEEHAEIWHEAASAAGRLQSAVERLERAARDVATKLEDALPEEVA